MWPWGLLSVSLTKASSSTKLSFPVWDVFSLPFGSYVSLAFLLINCLFIWKADYSNSHFQISGEQLELLLVKGHLQLCCKKPTSVLQGGVVEKVE